jgi:hypothetical protein
MTHPTFRIMMNQKHKFEKVAKGKSLQRRFHIQCTFVFFKKDGFFYLLASTLGEQFNSQFLHFQGGG